MGVPPSSANCLEGAPFLLLLLGAELILVPRPAAGIIANTFIAGCQYTPRKLRLLRPDFAFAVNFLPVGRCLLADSSRSTADNPSGVSELSVVPKWELWPRSCDNHLVNPVL